MIKKPSPADSGVPSRICLDEGEADGSRRWGRPQPMDVLSAAAAVVAATEEDNAPLLSSSAAISSGAARHARITSTQLGQRPIIQLDVQQGGFPQLGRIRLIGEHSSSGENNVIMAGLGQGAMHHGVEVQEMGNVLEMDMHVLQAASSSGYGNINHGLGPLSATALWGSAVGGREEEGEILKGAFPPDGDCPRSHHRRRIISPKALQSRIPASQLDKLGIKSTLSPSPSTGYRHITLNGPGRWKAQVGACVYCLPK